MARLEFMANIDRLALINSSILSSKGMNFTRDACVHNYGFLPCATNIPGFIFQIAVLEYLLLVGDKILTKGRQQLFSMLGVGIYGATIFRILTVLPKILLIIASGLVFENEKSTLDGLEIAAGLLAGSTVFGLTLEWGICVFLGRTKIQITENSSLPVHKSPKVSLTTSRSSFIIIKQGLSSLKEYGVTTDKDTRSTAGIMLLSLIPFIVAEVANTFKSQPWSHIAILTVSVAILVLYFVFQSRKAWIQERSLEYSKDQLMQSTQRIFRRIDKNKDNNISKDELRDCLAEFMKSLGVELNDQELIVNEVMKYLDKDKNQLITEEEFKDAMEKFIDAKQKGISAADNASAQKLRAKKPMMSHEEKKKLVDILKDAQNSQLARLLNHGMPDKTKIESLFEEFDKDKDGKISVEELKGMIMQSVNLDSRGDVVNKMMKVFDKDGNEELDQNEFLTGCKELLERKESRITKMSLRRVMKAVLRVIVGIAIVSSLGLPLVNNTRRLSERLGIPPFFISFVVLPLAMEFRTSMAAIFPASQKKERKSSIIFSEIYGAAFMNNTMGLLTLTALIWGRGFPWNYSAEVLVVLVVSATIGVIAFLHTTYPLWTGILAFSFYPLSLVLFYVIHYLLGLK